MISIIFPYGKNLPDIINSLDDKYEIFVAGSQNKKINHPNVRFVKESNLAESLLKCVRKSKGDYIAVFNDRVSNVKKCIKEMIERVENGADIVTGKRDEYSVVARIFVNLLLPKSRMVEDPLSDVFLIKKSVIENANLHPIGSKILLEIIAKGNYNRIEEIPVKMRREENFNESYSKYSHHLLKIAWKEGEILRFVKFGMVGLCSILLNETILWFLIEKNVYLILASIMSIELSILFAFLFNEIWTFRDRGIKKFKSFLKRMGKFNIASIAGLFINLFILLFLAKIFGIHPLKANIVGISGAFIWNFFAHNLWTWYE
ncbi:MAG TPA: glycosyltransferase [Thermoplasmatales archaeon]|nr:glycosyltransferase [Thermoplasmatales archaeon]